MVNSGLVFSLFIFMTSEVSSVNPSAKRSGHANVLQAVLTLGQKSLFTYIPTYRGMCLILLFRGVTWLLHVANAHPNHPNQSTASGDHGSGPPATGDRRMGPALLFKLQSMAENPAADLTSQCSVVIVVSIGE